MLKNDKLYKINSSVGFIGQKVLLVNLNHDISIPTFRSGKKTFVFMKTNGSIVLNISPKADLNSLQRNVCNILSYIMNLHF